MRYPLTAYDRLMGRLAGERERIGRARWRNEMAASQTEAGEERADMADEKRGALSGARLAEIRAMRNRYIGHAGGVAPALDDAVCEIDRLRAELAAAREREAAAMAVVRAVVSPEARLMKHGVPDKETIKRARALLASDASEASADAGAADSGGKE